MAKIEPKHFVAAFDLAEQVYDGGVTATEARKRLAKDLGLNHGSAGDFIAIFRRMMNAAPFKRSLSEAALARGDGQHADGTGPSRTVLDNDTNNHNFTNSPRMVQSLGGKLENTIRLPSAGVRLD